MDELLQKAKELILSERGFDFLEALLLLIGGLVVARVAGGMIGRLMRGHGTAQQRILIRRGAIYAILTIFALAALNAAGVEISVLLGAAGVLTVALGFAAQTSVSNVISGLFLLTENAFAVGDTISVDDVTGDVLSIDLLSVKLRTFDNLYVRQPNEGLLKARITNLSRFPIRRLDIPVGIAYREDVSRVSELLFDLAAREPLVLDEPRPVVLHQGFGDSAVQLQYSVWFLRENLIEVRNRIHHGLHRAFAEAEIEIPFPQRTLSLDPSLTELLGAQRDSADRREGSSDGGAG